jgi:hypothetical protein
VILTFNSFYFLKQHQQIDLCNGEVYVCVFPAQNELLNIWTVFDFTDGEVKVDTNVKTLTN